MENLHISPETREQDDSRSVRKEEISGPDNSKYREKILYVKKLYEKSEGKALLLKFIKNIRCSQGLISMKLLYNSYYLFMF